MEESDEGFSVEVPGPTGLLYKEGNRSMHIDSEILNQSEIAIVKESIKNWHPPYKDEPIDDNECNRVMENILRAFEFGNTKIEIW